MVKAAAGNGVIGEEAMSLLLDRRGDNIQTREGTVTLVKHHKKEIVLGMLPCAVAVSVGSSRERTVPRTNNSSKTRSVTLHRQLLLSTKHSHTKHQNQN